MASIGTQSRSMRAPKVCILACWAPRGPVVLKKLVGIWGDCWRPIGRRRSSCARCMHFGPAGRPLPNQWPSLDPIQSGGWRVDQYRLQTKVSIEPKCQTPSPVLPFLDASLLLPAAIARAARREIQTTFKINGPPASSERRGAKRKNAPLCASCGLPCMLLCTESIVLSPF